LTHRNSDYNRLVTGSRFGGEGLLFGGVKAAGIMLTMSHDFGKENVEK
jgi:hypothetical protein